MAAITRDVQGGVIMKTRKPNVHDKLNLVKECTKEILYGIAEFNTDRIVLAWFLMTEGLKGNCEIVEQDK